MITTRKIFESLYNGDFSAFERKMPQTQKNLDLYEKIEAEDKYFKQKMSDEDCQRFEKLQDLHIESSNYEQEDAFAYGFKLATMLMSAVFINDSEPTSKVK